MIRVSLRETIDRPIDEVFDRLVDIDAYEEWRPNGGIFVSCVQETPGAVEVGTRYTDRTRLGTATGEVVELERPTRVVFHYWARVLGARALDGWPGYTLERDGPDRTVVRHEAEAQLHGVFRLFRPVVQRLAESERRHTLDALKRSFD